MNWRFYTPDAEEAISVTPYFSLRPNKTCDSGWLDFFIWADYYKCRYCILDEKALLIVMKNKGEYFAALPYCKEEDLPHYFETLQSFFNEVLGQPFVIYLADEEGVEYLKLRENPNYYRVLNGYIYFYQPMEFLYRDKNYIDKIKFNDTGSVSREEKDKVEFTVHMYVMLRIKAEDIEKAKDGSNIEYEIINKPR